MDFLAQVAEAGPLMQYGALGVVLAWLLFRADKLLSSISLRIDGLTKAMLMDLVTRDNVGPHTRKEAQDQLTRIESSEK